MRSWRAIPHTSEAGLALEASSLEELFLAALEGLAALLYAHPPPAGAAAAACAGASLRVSSIDSTALLIDFLSEVLTRSEIARSVFPSATFVRLEETWLEALLEGFRVDAFDHDIKAVTHHQAAIRRERSGHYRTLVIFDI